LGGATNFPQRAALAFTPLNASTKVERIGAHHLCRKLQSQGHNARFLSVHRTVRLQQLRYGEPQFVDRCDAQAMAATGHAETTRRVRDGGSFIRKQPSGSFERCCDNGNPLAWPFPMQP
jgi:hypothetical protein